MKISNLIIQNKNIKLYTENDFVAKYKGKKIFITTDHGFGESKFFYLKRFLIDVIDIKTGMKDVDSYEDCNNIEEAIKSALIGACLLTN